MRKILIFAAAAALAGAVGLSSCNEDEDGNGESMSRDEMLALLEEVYTNMATAHQMSMEIKITSKKSTASLHGTLSTDFDAKKSLEVGYINGAMDEMEYIEGYTAYKYKKADSKGNTVKQRYKLTDAYWNRSSDDVLSLEDAFDDDDDDDDDEMEWSVKGNTFVGSGIDDNGERYTTTITITDKKISSIKMDSEASLVEVTYTYSANPALPEGFALSDFSLAEQYSIKVVWGEGLGESTFYTEPHSFSNYDFDPDDVVKHAPKVSGKKPELYSDRQFTKKFDSSSTSEYYSITVPDNSMVIYVKWVSGASGTKSAGKPSAKSLLKKLS